MRKLQIITFLGLFLVLASYCSKNEDNTVPLRNVNIDVHLADPSNVSLNAVGGWVYINGGVCGIVVYQRGQDDFVALERNCTYQNDPSNATITMDKSGSTLTDSNCKSQFQAYDGSLIKGPATKPLRTYVTSYDRGTRIIHIGN